MKSPLEPWASGDTVPSTWTVEVASMADVNKIIDKKLEELTLRVAKLEAKLKSSEEEFGERVYEPERPNQQPALDKPVDEKYDPTPGSDGKAEAKKTPEENPEEDKHEANASSGSKAEFRKNSDKEEPPSKGKPDAKKATAEEPDRRKDPAGEPAVKAQSDTLRTSEKQSAAKSDQKPGAHNLSEKSAAQKRSDERASSTTEKKSLSASKSRK